MKKKFLEVTQVEVEIGVGSPIPVHVILSGNLPDPCSQVEHTEIKQDGPNFIISLFATPAKDEGCAKDTVHRDERTFFIRLVAYLPAQTDCKEDSLPFRLEVPLNVVSLPEGPYKVNVNGASNSFDFPISQ